MKNSSPLLDPIASLFTALLVTTVTGGCASDQPRFDQERAFGYLSAQCNFGPRNPGSTGAEKTLSYFAEFFRERADTVILQEFEFADTARDTTFTGLTNVVARFNAGRLPRILLCAHWDTRPWADRDPDSTFRGEPILGANDGASGCAVLMELANLIPHIDTPYGIDIVLFDFEDYGEPGSGEHFCIGSKHYAGGVSRDSYAFGVLLDMIGDEDLRIYRETYSQTYARRVTDIVWKAARDVGSMSFVDSVKHSVYDDHIPFLEKGIPVIDIIDFDYEHWHTMGDTPDKCSAESLLDVGKVLVAVISR